MSLAKFHSSSFGCFEPGANSLATAAYGESAPAPGNFLQFLTFSRVRYFQSCTAVTISERQPSTEAMTKLLWWTLTCSSKFHGCPALSSVYVGCQWPQNLRMGEDG